MIVFQTQWKEFVKKTMQEIEIQLFLRPDWAEKCSQMFVDIIQQCFAFTPQANFPAHNLNFHWRWRRWDWIQATFQNFFYFKIFFGIGNYYKHTVYCRAITKKKIPSSSILGTQTPFVSVKRFTSCFKLEKERKKHKVMAKISWLLQRIYAVFIS